MKKAIRCEAVAQPFQQLACQFALGGTDGGSRPFGAIHIIDRHEGRFAAHGQAHITGLQALVHCVAQGLNDLPLFFGARLGDTRIFMNAGHLHLKAELGFALFGIAGDRRSARRSRGTRQRDMTLTSEQTRSWVQAQPTCTGYEYFGPGMQIGEISFRAGGAIQ